MILKRKLSNPLLISIILVLFTLHVFFWRETRYIFPELEITEKPPTVNSVKFMSFGDDEFYFRVLAWQLQFMGDSFGRASSLMKYDFKVLQQWFFLLDELNSRSHYVPAIAAYYFSMTQKIPDLNYIVEYLEKHSLKDINRNWWWIYQASYLAYFRLEEHKRAVELAKNLLNVKAKVPIWIKQLPAIYLEKVGELEMSYVIIKDILDNEKDLSVYEKNYINYFIKDRLNKMDKNDK